MIRRLTARTMAQQVGPAIEAALCPVVQGVNACHICDSVHRWDQRLRRRAMIAGLERVPGGSARRQCCLFGCSIQSFPHMCGKMRKAWCTQSTKEKECRCSSHLGNTTRCRQSMRACGSMSDCSLTWTTSGGVQAG